MFVSIAIAFAIIFAIGGIIIGGIMLIFVRKLGLGIMIVSGILSVLSAIIAVLFYIHDTYR